MKNEKTNTGIGTETARVAWFVTPHGFGHGARAAAVMAAMHQLMPHLHFDIFTLIPEFFFKESLPEGCFTYHPVETDIGLVQKSPLEIDYSASVRRLGEFLPFKDETIEPLAEKVNRLGCRMVVCDIAPMGIAVAKKAGITPVLVENFTWHWIYQDYLNHEPGFAPHIEYFKSVFEAAEVHIQTHPVEPAPGRHLLTPPVSRLPRNNRETVKKQLGIPPEEKMVMITMGGFPAHLPFISRLAEYRGVWFLIPGSKSFSRENHLIRLPYNSGFYHPDLIGAADGVICKLGYGTVSEVYHAGVPMAYIPRDNFRESRVMETFIQREMPGFPIMDQEFHDGVWLDRLPELLSMPRPPRPVSNGAAQIAQFLHRLLRKKRF